jgi:hypothetical protein
MTYKLYDGWAEQRSLRTIEGEVFFAGVDGRDAWYQSSDYPLRYFLARTSRDAWIALDDRGLKEAAIVRAAKAVRHELSAYSKSSKAFEDSEAITETGAEDLPILLPLHCEWTHDLDSDEVVMDSLDEAWLLTLSKVCRVQLDWDLVTYVFALHHVSEAVQLLSSKQVVKAGAVAIKARDWLWWANSARMISQSKWLSRREVSRKGATAAHVENRKVRVRAIEIYSARKWPSKMQAARTIASEIHRTELVVLRWIREFHKGVTVQAE